MHERWRVGRHVPKNLYLGERDVGRMDTPELAAEVVEAMNARLPSAPAVPPPDYDRAATDTIQPGDEVDIVEGIGVGLTGTVREFVRLVLQRPTRPPVRIFRVDVHELRTREIREDFMRRRLSDPKDSGAETQRTAPETTLLEPAPTVGGSCVAVDQPLADRFPASASSCASDAPAPMNRCWGRSPEGRACLRLSCHVGACDYGSAVPCPDYDPHERLRKAVRDREEEALSAYAESDELRAENARLRAALTAAAEALSDIQTHEESCNRGTAYSGDRAETADDAVRAALVAGQKRGAGT